MFYSAAATGPQLVAAASTVSSVPDRVPSLNRNHGAAGPLTAQAAGDTSKAGAAPAPLSQCPDIVCLRPLARSTQPCARKAYHFLSLNGRGK